MVSPLRTRQRITVLMNCSQFIILSICLFWFWDVWFFLINFNFIFLLACVCLFVCWFSFIFGGVGIVWRNNLICLISSRIFFFLISYYNYIHKPIRGRKKGQILQAIFYAWKLIIKPAVEGRGVAYVCRHFSYICNSRVFTIANNLIVH